MNDVMEQLHPGQNNHLEKHRRQGINPIGGGEIDDPSPLEALERATKSGFEVQPANPVVSKYLNEPGMSEDKLRGFIDNWGDVSDARMVKLVIEGTEHKVSLGEIRRHLGELEGESDWRGELEPGVRVMVDEFGDRIRDVDDLQILNELRVEVRRAIADSVKMKPWSLDWLSKDIGKEAKMMIEEKIEMIQGEKSGGQVEIKDSEEELADRLRRAGLVEHFQAIREKEGKDSFMEVLQIMAGELGEAESVSENPRPDWFPPELRDEILGFFGLNNNKRGGLL